MLHTCQPYIKYLLHIRLELSPSIHGSDDAMRDTSMKIETSTIQEIEIYENIGDNEFPSWVISFPVRFVFYK